MRKFIYDLYESLRMGIRAIRGHRLRAFLTTLGISIGIFSITMIFTLVNTLEYAVTSNLSSLGSTVLYVHNWPWKDNSEDWHKYFNRPKVSLADYEKLNAELKHVQAINFSYMRNGLTVKYGAYSAEGVSIIGCTQGFVYVNNFEIQEGRFLSDVEILGGRKVCVLGYEVAKSLFQRSEYALGRDVLIHGKKCKVIGVIAPQGDMNIFGPSLDYQVIIPYTTFANIFNVQQRMVDKLITVKAEHPDKVDLVESQIIGLLRSVRGLKPTQEDNFSVNKQEMLMEQLKNIFQSLSVGGAFISIFSLLVGGFGIANIMFVSVKERTVEIGIQKALGGTQRFILMEFLWESVLLCLLGGIVGIATVLGIAAIFQVILWANGFTLTITLTASNVLLGVILSATIGVISGFIPAYQASRLDPVEAMRA